MTDSHDNCPGRYTYVGGCGGVVPDKKEDGNLSVATLPDEGGGNGGGCGAVTMRGDGPTSSNSIIALATLLWKLEKRHKQYLELGGGGGLTSLSLKIG